MANTKVLRHNKKKSVTFSIKTGVVESFKDYCQVKGLVPSKVVEALIIKLMNT